MSLVVSKTSYISFFIFGKRSYRSRPEEFVAFIRNGQGETTVIFTLERRGTLYWRDPCKEDSIKLSLVTVDNCGALRYIRTTRFLQRQVTIKILPFGEDINCCGRHRYNRRSLKTGVDKKKIAFTITSVVSKRSLRIRFSGWLRMHLHSISSIRRGLGCRLIRWTFARISG